MSATPLDASVIVPTYGDGASLSRCLAALAAQTHAAERFEVLVVDNEEVPRPAPRLPPNARWLHEPSPGSYAARNRALREARGALLAFTDADCVPADDWVAAGVAALGRAPEVARLAGAVDLMESGPVTAATLHERVFGFRQERLADRGTSVTANMWARRAVFDAIGPFDPALRSGGDVAWGLAAQARGFAVRYAPEVRVSHPSRDAAALVAKARRVYAGEFTLAGSGAGPRPLTLLRGLALLKPPVRRMRDALATGTLSGAEPLLVAWMESRLRLAQYAEHVRLTFGGAPPR